MAEVEGQIHLQKQEIMNGQWFSLSEAFQKIVHPEGKATLKATEQILNNI